MKNKNLLLKFCVVVVALFLSVGYAVVSSVYLNVGGAANAANTELNVEITSVVATTSIEGKNVNFSNVLSGNNLTSNFTLKEMTLGEVVNITYTVTNNEKDVDSELALADGVLLTNSNSEFFKVNYEITDSLTDLKNNDKTMEVIVTVELIKTPVTESESISDVVLTLSAGPKGANRGSFVSTPVDDERLDNVWPLEWNTFDVMENTSFEDGFLVRISRLAPSLSELQSAQLYANLDGEMISGHFFDYMQEGNAVAAIYINEGQKLEYAVLSVQTAGEYYFDSEEPVVISEPGLYVANYGLYGLDADVSLVKQKNYGYYYLLSEVENENFNVTFDDDMIIMTPNSYFYENKYSKEEWTNKLLNKEVVVKNNADLEHNIELTFDIDTLSISFNVESDTIYYIDYGSYLYIGIQEIPLEKRGVIFNTIYTLRLSSEKLSRDYPIKLEFTPWGTCICSFADGSVTYERFGNIDSSSIIFNYDIWDVFANGKEVVAYSLGGDPVLIYTIDGYEPETFLFFSASNYECIIDNVSDDDITLSTSINFHQDGSAQILNPNVNKPAGYYTFDDKKITNSENDYYMVISDDGFFLTEYRNGEVAYVWRSSYTTKEYDS